MFLEHVYSKGLAHSSYVAGSGNTCVVVDPTRNINRYLEIASSNGMSIAAVLETHLHADFISGHMELAEATGARIYAPASAGCRFPHVPLQTGKRFLSGSSLSALSILPVIPRNVQYMLYQIWKEARIRFWSSRVIPSWWGTQEGLISFLGVPMSWLQHCMTHCMRRL